MIFPILVNKKLVSCVLIFVAFTVFIVSCGKDPDTSISPQSIQFQIPDGWPTPFYIFSGNEVTKGGFELGKKIFYDRRLSRDYSTSCGSCHQSFAAFAQSDHDVSHGVDDLTGTRNSPSLFNVAWATSFFWDGGVNHIEVQPLNPIQNPVEMDMKVDSVIARLSADPDYRDRFQAVFGSPEITTQRVFKSLAQFMGMMVSADAKYDRNAKGIAGNEFTASELAGKTIFESKCAGCHVPPLFTDFSFRNNGLPASAFHDSGRYGITKSQADLFKFKVPSLRNLQYTKPYMHDGRFKTLEQVFDHYDHGVVAGPTVDTLLTGGVGLNTQERIDLLAFLNTLNDQTFVNDKRFAER